MGVMDTDSPSTFAEVVLNAPLHGTFSYRVPPHLYGRLAPGHLVSVPFRTDVQPAIIWALQRSSDVPQPKNITDLLHPDPVLSAEHIALAQQISAETLAPLGLCAWLWLPPGLSGHRDERIALRDPAHPPKPQDAAEAALIDLLARRGPQRLRAQLRPALRRAGIDKPDAALHRLLKAEVLTREPLLTPPQKAPPRVDTAALAVHPEALPGLRRHLGRASARADLLEAVAELTDGSDQPVAVDRVLAAAKSTRATLRKLADEESLVVLDAASVRLNIPLDAVDEQLMTLRKGEKQYRVLRVLARESGPVDVSWVYAQADAKLSDLKALAAMGLIHLGERKHWRDTLGLLDFVPSAAPPLIAEQQAAWELLRERLLRGQHGTVLLQGVTGSGKTEIYLRTIDLVLRQGRQALLLVPEIALTALTVQRVAARFPGRTAVVHSRLSEGERFDTWQRARNGEISVVVGPRSALFTPLPDLGVIVVDEEHDASYKNFAAPTYDTRQVAEALMAIHGGLVILGSATPSLESAYRARQGDIQHLRLPQRILGHRQQIAHGAARQGLIPTRYTPHKADALTAPLPPVTLVDMRAELKAGNTSIFSDALGAALNETLARHEQAILLLNRRGQATYVFCRDCGYVARSPDTGLPLTYHQQGDVLICHHSGKRYGVSTQCPDCGSRRFRFFGAGTQQVEAAVRDAFPQARVLRVDSDAARQADLYAAMLARFAFHDADVLVGTQMVARGLNLARVTLVGVISADVGLNLPDFRAGERTFQLLTQAAGRAGRSILGGQVILQTYQPEHYVMQAAAQHDVDSFIAQELAFRAQMGYPPYRRLARLLFRHPNENHARDAAHQAADRLRAVLHDAGDAEVMGPAPCFYARLDDRYRWQVLLRAADPVPFIRAADPQGGWHVELDPLELL